MNGAKDVLPERRIFRKRTVRCESSSSLIDEHDDDDGDDDDDDYDDDDGTFLDLLNCFTAGR